MKRVDNRSPPIYNTYIGRQKSRLPIPTINKGLKGTIMNPKIRKEEQENEYQFQHDRKGYF